MAEEKVILRVEEDPIIMKVTGQGMPGRTGPAGAKGEPGTSWELAISMEGAMNGTCIMSLYKDGMLCSDEQHYAYIQIKRHGEDTFQPSEYNSNFMGTYSFQYANVHSVLVTVFEDSFMQRVLCADSFNYGDTATIEVGSTTTLPEGSQASVTNSGTTLDAVLQFAIPKGDTGKAATINIGTVQTGVAGTAASVVNSGTENEAVFDFVLPRGENGDGYAAAQYDEPEEGIIFEVAQNMLSEMAFVDDAPSDGNEYVRKDGDWEEKAPQSWGGITGTLSDQTDLNEKLDVLESITSSYDLQSESLTITI